MSKNSLKLNKAKFMLILALFCIVFAIINTLYAAGQPRQRQSRRGRGGGEGEARSGDVRGTERQDERMQERSEAVGNAAEAIDTNLVEMLNLVNELQRPNMGQMGSAQRSLEKSRKYLKEFSENITCQYYMLNAWINYFDSDAEKALMPATQAFRKDSSNNDAHATQAAMAILSGQKPLNLRPEKQAQQDQEPAGRMTRGGAGRQSRGRTGRQGTPSRRGRTGSDAAYGSAGAGGTYSGTVSSGNILNLNADSIKADWLGQKIGSLQFSCLNGTKFSYDPADEKLCMLFWNLTSQDSAGNSDSEESRNIGLSSSAPAGGRYERSRSRPDRMSRMGRASMPDRTTYQTGRGAFDNADASGDPLSSQMSAFANLFNSEFQNPGLKFVAINTDPPQSKPEVMAKLLENPWPWAQTMLNNPPAAEQLADTNIAKLDSAEPMLVICGENGTAKYAGPAAGFLAPMVLRELTGTDPGLGAQYLMPAQTDPNLLASLSTPAGSSITTEAIGQPQVQLQQNTDITAEDFQAQKLLEYARGLFVPAGRKRFLSSKTAVDLCRQIINEYPNTSYADEARKLLRTVPPEEQKRYNITNEEMGL
jgi:hypothetical protein